MSLREVLEFSTVYSFKEELLGGCVFRTALRFSIENGGLPETVALP